MALQRPGIKDMGRLLDEREKWSAGNPLEQSAVAAALCEPALLKDKKQHPCAKYPGPYHGFDRSYR